MQQTDEAWPLQQEVEREVDAAYRCAGGRQPASQPTSQTASQCDCSCCWQCRATHAGPACLSSTCRTLLAGCPFAGSSSIARSRPQTASKPFSPTGESVSQTVGHVSGQRLVVRLRACRQSAWAAACCAFAAALLTCRALRVPSPRLPPVYPAAGRPWLCCASSSTLCTNCMSQVRLCQCA